MLLYEKLHWRLSTTYYRVEDVLFSIGGRNQFLLVARSIFCMEKNLPYLENVPYLSLKKGIRCKLLGGIFPLCLRLCTIPLKATSDFSEKISLKRGAINCFECNVKHFDVHLMWTNLTLVSNKNKTRQRYLSYFIQSGKTDRFPLI